MQHLNATVAFTLGIHFPKFFPLFFDFDIDKRRFWRYDNTRRRGSAAGSLGSIAQLGEHLPYKQRVTGSSPVVPTNRGPVVQLVRMPACHAGGRGFEPLPGRHCALVAQSVEQQTENLRVGGSIPPQGTMCAVVAQW